MADLLLIVTIAGHLRRFLTGEGSAEAALLLGIGILLAMRSFFEIDIMNPYHIGSFLLYFAAGRLTVRRPEKRPALDSMPVVRRLPVTSLAKVGWR